MLHHDFEKLYNDLRGRPDHHLSVSTLLSVTDGVQGIVEYVDPHHGCRRPTRTGTAQAQLVSPALFRLLCYLIKKDDLVFFWTSNSRMIHKHNELNAPSSVTSYIVHQQY